LPPPTTWKKVHANLLEDIFVQKPSGGTETPHPSRGILYLILQEEIIPDFSSGGYPMLTTLGEVQIPSRGLSKVALRGTIGHFSSRAIRSSEILWSMSIL